MVLMPLKSTSRYKSVVSDIEQVFGFPLLTNTLLFFSTKKARERQFSGFSLSATYYQICSAMLFKKQLTCLIIRFILIRVT